MNVGNFKDSRLPPPNVARAGRARRAKTDAPSGYSAWYRRAERLDGRARRRARWLVDRIGNPFVGSVRGVHGAPPVVVLTFDDGPDAVATPALLDRLAAH